MALQVWLPLNGDLHNQGLQNITVTNNGAVINNNGKIGKCCSFGTAESYLSLPTSAMTSFTTECSISFWLNILSWNGSYATFFQAGTASSSWANYVFGFLRNSSNSNCCFTISDGSAHSGTNYLTPNLDLNTWYHISLVYKTGHCLIYVNGELYQDYTTTIVPNFSSIARIRLGHSNGSGYQSNCLINDFRIYNHALSAEEVAEIAKGLVLHYPLSGSYNESTTNLCAELLAGGRTVVSNNIISSTGENADTYWYIMPKEAFVGGETYTFSCNLTGFAADTDFIQFGVGAQTSSSATHCGQWKIYNGYNTFTFVAPSALNGSTAKFIFDDSGSTAIRAQIFHISNVQLEKKPYATQFVDYGASRESTTIYDISGYGNNGEIIESIETTSDSPKNNYATHFAATNQKIKISNLSVLGFTNSYSFAWWEKINSVNNMCWGFSDGVRLNGMYTGRLWSTGDGSSNPLYTPGTTTQVDAPTANIWHHWVMTGNDTKCLVYQDGELWGEAKTVKPITGTTIYLNGWNETTNYSSSNASMSDFRIYATPLTADQVAQLYRDSMVVDSSGNITPRDLE